MDSAFSSYLKSLLQEATRSLPETSWRKMFGCEAIFARGKIFGLIWKTGRIGIKIPDPTVYMELMNVSGAEPWTAGDRTMSSWILVPEAFHDQFDTLTDWVRKSYQMVMSNPSKEGKSVSKRVAKKAKN